jgi:hypothetical protein
MDFKITNEEFQIAVTIANDTLELFSSRRGHYNNTVNSHLRGKLGEIAVARFFGESGFMVNPVFRDLNQMAEADIVIPGKCRIEVKTWSKNFWPSMGRCIAVDQLAKLQQKADLLVWCVSDDELAPNMQITIAGWNLISDIPAAPRRLTGSANGRKVDNYQLEPTALREISDITSFVKGI